MTHAIVNNNSNVSFYHLADMKPYEIRKIPKILHHYLVNTEGTSSNPRMNRVPVTLKHFQILARLGHTPVR